MKSVDDELINLFKVICAWLNIPTNIPKGQEASGYGSSAEKLHQIVKKRINVTGLVINAKKRARMTDIVNNTIISKITKIEQEDYDGDVYNLGVEDDNSYGINHAVLHNCGMRDP